MKNKAIDKKRMSARFEVKTLDDASGIFEGYASAFNNVDLGGDLIEKGAFTRSLQQRKSIPILWQHNTSEPIGLQLEAKEDATGLFVKGQLNLETVRGREAYALLKQGALAGLSIGYDVVRQEQAKGGVRRLKELRLWEWSLVTFPMNPEATVTAVKECYSLTEISEEEAGDDTMSDYLKKSMSSNGVKALVDIMALQELNKKRDELRRARYQLGYAVDDAIDAIIRSTLTLEAQQAEINSVLMQYSTLLQNWLAEWKSVQAALAAVTPTQALQPTATAGAPGPEETKAGKTISKANMQRIQDAHAACTKAVEHLSALLPTADSDEDPPEEGTAPAGGKGENPQDIKALADLIRNTTAVLTTS